MTPSFSNFLNFKNSTIIYRMTNNPMELQYLGSPTRPTSSGLLGSGSSINPCSNKDVNKSSTSS